eukprot:2475166-Amphidinium_carterae.1
MDRGGRVVCWSQHDSFELHNRSPILLRTCIRPIVHLCVETDGISALDCLHRRKINPSMLTALSS